MDFVLFVAGIQYQTKWYPIELLDACMISKISVKEQDDICLIVDMFFWCTIIFICIIFVFFVNFGGLSRHLQYTVYLKPTGNEYIGKWIDFCLLLFEFWIQRVIPNGYQCLNTVIIADVCVSRIKNMFA